VYFNLNYERPALLGAVNEFFVTISIRRSSGSATKTRGARSSS